MTEVLEGMKTVPARVQRIVANLRFQANMYLAMITLIEGFPITTANEFSSAIPDQSPHTRTLTSNTSRE